MGSGAAGTAPRRPIAVPVRWGPRSLPEWLRFHRRLLRLGHLGPENIRPVCLDQLPIERNGRRGWARVLPAAGAGDRAALRLRIGVLAGLHQPANIGQRMTPGSAWRERRARAVPVGYRFTW